MSYPSLNHRHKVGLFFVLVATGISLFFEASAKQTTGVVLLGLAATWLVGNLSLRVLWLLSSLVSCAVGASLVAVSVLQGWNSFQISAQDYDTAIAELRQAIAVAGQEFTDIRPIQPTTIPIPECATLEPLPNQPGTPTAQIDYGALAALVRKCHPTSSAASTINYDARAKKWTMGSTVNPAEFDPDKFMAERHPPSPPQGKRQKTDQIDAPLGFVPVGPTGTQGQYTAADIDWDTTVEIPAATRSWEQPYPSLAGKHIDFSGLGGRLVLPTMLSFSPSVDREELISSFQSQLLRARPKFSIRASLISDRLYSVIGFAFLTAGLFCLGWCVRSVLRAKRAHAPQLG